MRSAEPEVLSNAREASRDAARQLFALAARYAGESHPQRLFYTVGLSGSGKTWLADGLACRIGAVVLSTDMLREGPPGQSDGVAFGEGRYAAEERSRVYDRMRERARDHLARGRSVILDATHLARPDRDAARALGREIGVDSICIGILANDDLIRTRIEQRQHEGASASEATWEIYAIQKQHTDPLSDDEVPRVMLDGGASVTANIRQVLGAIA
jgi:predicted kinase